MPTPSSRALYERVKAEVYREIPRHSAYRSGTVVKRYKRAFAEKHGAKRPPYKGDKPTRRGLARWFAEDWRNQRGEYGYRRAGDIYRPTFRITKRTPLTHGELTRREVRRARREKATKGRVRRFRGKATRRRRAPRA